MHYGGWAETIMLLVNYVVDCSLLLKFGAGFGHVTADNYNVEEQEVIVHSMSCHKNDTVTS